MPSIQKIVLTLTFVASALAAQISDGQLQQPTSIVTPVPVVKQITDGQLQQATSVPAPVVITSTTPTPVVTPAIKQITDGQVQQVASASKAPIISANATVVTTPSAPATFKGAASLTSYSSELVAAAIGAAALFAVL